MKFSHSFLVNKRNYNMRKIFKIAVLELSILFYSPVAWLVLVIFIIQNGMAFLGMISAYQEVIAMGNKVDNLTVTLFPAMNGLFDRVQQTIYLYIPLLTMGLMSREISSGSIKLLLSSPVKITEIILGKYLAIVGYGLLMMAVLGLYALVGIAVIKDADVMLMISGLSGIFLLICTYAAIGLFMSSLTSYQVVAAISTLAVFGVLQFIGTVGQDINFVRDLTYFLSISGRADDMLNGLITTKDVIYFVLIIMLFLCLCIFRLQAGRESRSRTFQAGKYALLIFAVMLIGYVSSRPGLVAYKDMTAMQSRTLTQVSREAIEKIDGALKITTYVNLLDQNVYLGLPGSRNSDLKQFEQYQRYIPGLKMDYVYYYDATDLKNNPNMVYQGDLTGLNTKQIAEKVADNMGLNLDQFMPPAEIRKRINLEPESNNLVRVLEYKGKKSWLRFYNEVNQFADEAEITAAIKRLTVKVPRLVFITGNNERSADKKGDRNYEAITNARKNRTSLINQGFDVVNVNLDKEDIPEDGTVLVLADPTTELTMLAQQKIKGYLDDGGDMMVTGEPGRQGLINPVLEHVGVQMQEGMLVKSSKDYTPEQIFAESQDGGTHVFMPTAAALGFNAAAGFKAYSLLVSPSQGWNKQGIVDLTSTDVKYNALAGDKKGEFPVVLTLTRGINGKEQHILVSGDADFMSNATLIAGKGANKNFVKSIFKWFSGDEFPIDVSRQRNTDDAVLLKRKEISTLKMVLLGVIPGLIIALGAFILISRKRK